MDELMAWIREQLDEDERVARAAMRENPLDLVLCLHLPPEVQQHNTRHDPARVLREVEAKRRIAGIHDRYASKWPNALPSTRANCCDGCGYEGDCDDPVIEDVNQCPELRALAAIYSDRPGYQEEWRP